ncbi:predicted protein [Histoplasma capsulatum G186AR]|uniref:Uncharacterized protein n=1 Tax=Ajellomyces capsulatus (strain G186AR / H82 / ATCC MYA-2454 / RMSCC 2432) TaxID=447093 RepID=C0NRE2_AJECG|nr:uncharacterized protein HCBG_05572 [Histoplasma capsulatum G186AR]EEH06256.1 predicted protein [Histoplasma capsulatum G186AR]
MSDQSKRLLKRGEEDGTPGSRELRLLAGISFRSQIFAEPIFRRLIPSPKQLGILKIKTQNEVLVTKKEDDNSALQSKDSLSELDDLSAGVSFDTELIFARFSLVRGSVGFHVVVRQKQK